MESRSKITDTSRVFRLFCCSLNSMMEFFREKGHKKFDRFGLLFRIYTRRLINCIHEMTSPKVEANMIQALHRLLSSVYV